MTAQDRITIGGFVSLGALVVALGSLMFIQIDRVEARLNSRIDEGEARMARFEGTLSAVAALVGLNETPDEPGRERLPPGRP